MYADSVANKMISKATAKLILTKQNGQTTFELNM